MTDNLSSQIQELIDNGIGDVSRLQHIKETLEDGKTIYKSDRNYLDSLISKYFDSKETPHEHIEETDADKPIQEKKSKEDNESKLQKQLEEANRKIENLEKRTSFSEEQSQRQAYYKSEGTTLVFSIILGIFGLQGIGHIYVGKVGKGVAILLIGIILYGIAIFTMVAVVTMGILLMIGYFILFIWQILDSRDLCRKYNDYIRDVGKRPW